MLNDNRRKNPAYTAASENDTERAGRCDRPAANRVAQYEMGYRVPKKPLLEQMAQALQVSPLALQEPNTGNISDIMETLFWMDEDVPGVFRLTTIQFDDPDCWREEYQEEGAEACLHGNIVLPSSVVSAHSAVDRKWDVGQLF